MLISHTDGKRIRILYMQLITIKIDSTSKCLIRGTCLDYKKKRRMKGLKFKFKIRKANT